jgi:type I restriction enzyme R subunit
MNEADTRAELIEPQLKASGWGVVSESKITREYNINLGQIHSGGVRGERMIADYVLVYKNKKIAVVEAKADQVDVSEGVAQAKLYAKKLHIENTFSANGKQIYQMCLESGKEEIVLKFPTPDELWNKTFTKKNEWIDKFDSIPFESVGGNMQTRFYQEIAINKVMESIANNHKRILLTLATGTGKTFIAFQIAWKLFKTKWNLGGNEKRLPKILFLADRNILATQAFNDFNAFEENALVRIKPSEISRTGSVPTSGSIFFTIFQTFMSGEKKQPYFGQYPADFFDFIIVDECHRGGANDESNWRGILEYFKSAVQLGLTATPKRNENVDTYNYFGKPVYSYSLKEGINDGFLTPYKVKRIQTTMDKYIYTGEDEVVEGDPEKGKIYEETDFNKIIEIEARERKRVQLILDNIKENEKTIVFCASQNHAAQVRDYINQQSKNRNSEYCVRVTADDLAIGDTHLANFQNNDKVIPTILTTSHKLSTGVNALNIRNIVLMRTIKTIIEFKQIMGRGTRLFDGKHFFTIIDFVDAYDHFKDPEWDGPPADPGPKPDDGPKKNRKGPPEPPDRPQKIKIRLSDNKERSIQSTASTYYYFKGKSIGVQEYIKSLFNTLKLPDFFKSEEDLRNIWSSPITRNELLKKLEQNGFLKENLEEVQKLVNAEDSDLFDVLEYISFAKEPIARKQRVGDANNNIFAMIDIKQKEFIEFVLDKYIKNGVDQLDVNNLSKLIELKYKTIYDAENALGNIDDIKKNFINFQKFLYQKKVA